jgi:hypothetical protein
LNSFSYACKKKFWSEVLRALTSRGARERDRQTHREQMALDARGQRVVAWGTALLLFVALMIVTPRIPQDQKYHQFADRRNFIGE